jgi:predicted transcriptional regulator
VNITVDEYTSVSPITVDLNADLKVAEDLMKENEIRHLPVMEGKEVVGLVSQRDIFANVGKPWSEFMRVKSVMSTSILFAYANDNLADVAYRLSSEKVGSAIILDEDNQLYGIFTTTDALNALVEILLPERTS